MKSGIWVSPTEFRSFAERTEPLAGHVASRLAAGDLSSFFGLLPNPDPVLKAMGQDIAVYRSLLVDPLIKGIRRRRIAAVLAMERGFEQEESNTPARVRRALEKAVAGLDVQGLVRQMMDGAFFGYRVLENLWAYRDGLQLPVPVAKPSEWFGFDAESGDLRFKPRSTLQGVPVDPHKFIVVGKMRSWENPYGEPDLAACFWPVVFKRGGLKFWVTFTEKYGMPWAVGKLPRNTAQPEVDQLADRLAAMVRDAVAVVPDDSSVDLVQAHAAAREGIYERLLMFCRSEINIALLGNNQSVEAEANRASATAASVVEEDLQDDDGQMVAEGINQWVRQVCSVNWPGVEPPVYKFWRQESVDEVRAKRDQTLHQAGAVFTPAYFERAYNLEPGDLAAPTPAAAGAAGDPAPPAALSFAEGEEALAPDQAALDAAIELLPGDALTAAMRKMLAPALAAIEQAATPAEVLAALDEAWPDMDVADLQALMEQAFFVADLVGRDAVREESAA